MHDQRGYRIVLHPDMLSSLRDLGEAKREDCAEEFIAEQGELLGVQIKVITDLSKAFAENARQLVWAPAPNKPYYRQRQRW